MSRFSCVIILCGLTVAACSQCSAASPTEDRCGDYSYTKSLIMVRESNFSAVKLTATVGGGTNPCAFYAYAKLTSPTNRVDIDETDPDFVPYNAVAVASLEMGTEDGNYTASGKWWVQDDTEDENPPPTYPANGPGDFNSFTQYINGFVQLSNTDWSPSTTTSSGFSWFNAHLYSSDSCGGSVTVQGALVSVPPNLNFSWFNMPYPQSTATRQGYAVGAQHTVVQFSLDLNGGNTGQVKARATIMELPPNCDVRGPISGGSAEATLTVN